MSARSPERQPARTAVVTVNYRTPELVIKSLEALRHEREDHGGVEVVVVDNDSGDSSIDLISDAVAANDWKSWVTLVASPVNGGFSAGNNLGVQVALDGDHTPDYLFLLNSDAYVLPGAVPALVEFLDRHPDVGIAGSRLRKTDGKLWPYSFVFPSVLGEFEAGIQSRNMSQRLERWRMVKAQTSDDPEPVGWLGGAAMMVRREVFEEVGLMDEGYFLYFEETDLCLQAERAGWSNWYVPGSEVVHAFGGSTGIDPNKRAVDPLPRAWFDSRRRYFVKNHGRLYAAGADLARISGVLASRVRRKVKRQEDLHPPRMLTDCIRNSVFLRPPVRRPRPPSASEPADSMVVAVRPQRAGDHGRRANAQT